MNRLWLCSSVMLLWVVNLFANANSCRADEHSAADKLLPKETLVFFTISDVPEMKKKWEKTSTGQLLREPQLQPFLEDVTKKIHEACEDFEEDLGLSISDLLELPQGELTFALLEKPARKLAGIIMLDYGDNQETIDKLLKKMDDALDKGKAEHATEEVGNIKVHVYKLKKDDPDSPIDTWAYFTADSNIVFSNEVEALKEVLERWKGDSDDTLAQNDQYKYIQTQCKVESGEPLIKMFLSPTGLIQTGISMAQSSIPQIGMFAGFLPLLGVDGLKGFGGTLSFDEGDFDGVMNTFLYVENPKGLVGIFNFPAIEMAPPKWVSATTASYVLVNWNFQAAYTSIESLVDSFQGRGATARALDAFAEQGPMIHLKKDVIDHLDGKIHLVQGEHKEAEDGAYPVPSFFAGFGLKDAAKMKKTVTAAAKFAGPQLESREFNGETIYEANQPDNDQAVAFAITEGTLILTNDVQLLEGVMRGQSGRGLSLVDSPDYKKVAKVFPSKVSMLSFQQSDTQLKTYYNLMRNAGSEAIDGLDFGKLPPFDVISKYTSPSGGYTVPDKKGAKSVSFSLKRNE